MNDEQQLSDGQITEIRKRIKDEARHLLFLEVKYQLGAEWTDYTKDPEFLDCSEEVEGVIRKCGLKMPDGAQAQFNFTIATQYPLDGDFGFFAEGKDITQVYHSGIYTGDGVIEMRKFDANCSFPTGKIIIRPVHNWEQWKNFAGWRAHPKLVQVRTT